MTTTYQIGTKTKALAKAGRKVREWTERRDTLICEAVAGGMSLREVGSHVGLSHMAVSFIAHGRGQVRSKE